MKEIYSRWCDVGNRTMFRLKIFETEGGGLTGELYKIENAYMTQCSIDKHLDMSVGDSEEITGSDIEEFKKKAIQRIQKLRYKFSKWMI